MGYKISMGLMRLMATALFLFCFFTTKERLDHQPEKFYPKVLVKNDQWLLLCFACITGTVGYVIRSSVANYYAKYYLGGRAGMISNF